MQEQIVKVVGLFDVGGVVLWLMYYLFLIEDDEQGCVMVSWMISIGLFDCKEIVFVVDMLVKVDKVV